MKKRWILLISFTLVLASCFGTTSLEFVPYTNSTTELDTFQSEVATYHLPANAYFNNNSLHTTEITNFAQIESSHDNNIVFSEEDEEVHLLVVPMSFSGAIEDEQAEKTILLQNAFFGDSSKTAYQSVASYYDKSSYGHVQIKGQVTDWFTSSCTIEEARATSTPLKVSSDIANEIVAWLINSGFDLSDYLSEDQTYIRGLYIVYDYPPNYDDSKSLFWAYVDRASTGAMSPFASTYAWSSIDFIGQNAYSSHYVETNTFIHEVGHLFGLRDYYNTIDNDGYQPTGFFDMMDYNLGDHCSFSKYLLHWATPYVLQEAETITLRSFTESGDFILIPTSTWNGTPYDEYLLVEYFTPDGLNDSSTFSSYIYTDGYGENRVFYYPNYHGLRIYHIDARLAYYRAPNGRAPIGYVDNLTVENLSSYTSLYVGLAHDNSPSNTAQPTLCHLLSAEGDSHFENGIAADNNTLFAYHDTFGMDTDSYANFTFNKNNELLPYSMMINHMGTDQITITFTAKNS
ncbi:MAG: hypothetical protein WC201_05260 [Bacilli bacterium]